MPLSSRIKLQRTKIFAIKKHVGICAIQNTTTSWKPKFGLFKDPHTYKTASIPFYIYMYLAKPCVTRGELCPLSDWQICRHILHVLTGESYATWRIKNKAAPTCLKIYWLTCRSLICPTSYFFDTGKSLCHWLDKFTGLLLFNCIQWLRGQACWQG